MKPGDDKENYLERMHIRFTLFIEKGMPENCVVTYYSNSTYNVQSFASI